MGCWASLRSFLYLDYVPNLPQILYPPLHQRTSNTTNHHLSILDTPQICTVNHVLHTLPSALVLFLMAWERKMSWIECTDTPHEIDRIGLLSFQVVNQSVFFEFRERRMKKSSMTHETVLCFFASCQIYSIGGWFVSQKRSVYAFQVMTLFSTFFCVTVILISYAYFRGKTAPFPTDALLFQPYHFASFSDP